MADRNKGIILSNSMERYIDVDHSYLYKTLGIKVISKDAEPDYSSMIVYKDGDAKDLNVGDIVQTKGTNEQLIFVCKSGKFAYLCPLDSDVEIKEFRRLPKSKLFKKVGELDKARKLDLIYNIKEALEIDKFIPNEIKEIVHNMVKKY